LLEGETKLATPISERKRLRAQRSPFEVMTLILTSLSAFEEKRFAW